MISGLSKAITLYLAPLLALTAIILSLLAYLAPTLLLHDQVALITVVPSTALVQLGTSQSVDGPSVFLGVLGMKSCYSYTKIRLECRRVIQDHARNHPTLPALVVLLLVYHLNTVKLKFYPGFRHPL